LHEHLRISCLWRMFAVAVQVSVVTTGSLGS
jgi:hypothetical protein